jgi:uncharacterized membrane protein YkoI
MEQRSTTKESEVSDLATASKLRSEVERIEDLPWRAVAQAKEASRPRPMGCRRLRSNALRSFSAMRFSARNRAQLNGSVSNRVEGRMIRTRMFGLTLAIVLGFAAAIFAAQPSEAELMKQAKITKAEAEQIALAKVSHGIVKSAEIEKEKGHLVWSFDIARPGAHDITEILVDAKTGKIISTQTESPRDQAREAAADKKQN